VSRTPRNSPWLVIKRSAALTVIGVRGVPGIDHLLKVALLLIANGTAPRVLCLLLHLLLDRAACLLHPLLCCCDLDLLMLWLLVAHPACPPRSPFSYSDASIPG
jgi:hypothetical protein